MKPGAFQQALHFILICSIVLPGPLVSHAGQRDETWAGYQNRPTPVNYQPSQPRFDASPTLRLQQEVQFRSQALQLQFRQPAESKPSLPAPRKLDIPQPKFQFSANKPTQVPAFLAKPDTRSDKLAQTNRPRLIDSVQRGLQAMGHAAVGVFKKIGEGFKSLVQKVLPFTRSAPQGPDKSLQAALRDYPHLQAMNAPGLVQVKAGGIAHVHGRVWQPGSTFKVQGERLHLVQGMTQEIRLGGIERADQMAFPVLWQGNETGQGEPIGIDFSKIQPNTTFKITEPMPIEGLGEVSPGEMTFLGASSQDTVTSEGDLTKTLTGLFQFSQSQVNVDLDMPGSPSARRNLELSLMSFALKSSGMSLEHAVFKQGDKKLYLSPKGEIVDVTGLDEKAGSLLTQSQTLSKKATKASKDITHGVQAANEVLDTLARHIGIPLGAAFEGRPGLQRLADEASRLAQLVGEAQGLAQKGNYDPLVGNLQILEAEQASLEQEIAIAQTQAQAFQGFAKSLIGLAAAHQAISPAADPQSLQTPVTDLAQLDQAAHHFPSEKAQVRITATNALNNLTDLAEQGALPAADAKAWGMVVLALRNQLLAAAPVDNVQGVKHVVRDTLDESYDRTKGAVDGVADKAFFDHLDRAGEAVPTFGITIGTIYLAQAKAVSTASQAVGYGLLAYGAVTASLTTGLAVGVTVGVQKGLEYLGVKQEAALAYGAVAGLFTGTRMARSKTIRAKEGQIADTLFAKAENLFAAAKESLAGLSGRTGELLANEKGHVSVGGKSQKEILPLSSGIQTPFGLAVQENSSEAMAALKAVKNGASLFRKGTIGKQNAAEGQFWSLENPLTVAGYEKKLGMPAQAAAGEKIEFVICATLKPGAQAITRKAPGIGSNTGGTLEAVVDPGNVKIEWMHTLSNEPAQIRK